MTEELLAVYKRDVDRTLLMENLKLTPQQRFDKFKAAMQNLMALREAGFAARRQASHEKTEKVE